MYEEFDQMLLNAFRPLSDYPPYTFPVCVSIGVPVGQAADFHRYLVSEIAFWDEGLKRDEVEFANDPDEEDWDEEESVFDGPVDSPRCEIGDSSGEMGSVKLFWEARRRAS